MTRIYLAVLFSLTVALSATPAHAAFTLSYGTTTNTVAANNGTDLMTVACPAGAKVISGGWEANSEAGKYLMVWVSRQVANAWRIMTVNTHPSQSYSITGYAVCASGVNGLGSYSSSIAVNVAGNSGATGSAYCPNGGIPTGGGFDSNYPNPNYLVPTETRPGYQNTWITGEYNSTNQSKAFTAYITCMTGVSGSVSQRYGSWSSAFRNGPSATTSVSCNANEFAVGGGFATSLTTASLPDFRRYLRVIYTGPSTNKITWLARAHNANQWDWGYVMPYVQCLLLN